MEIPFRCRVRVRHNRKDVSSKQKAPPVPGLSAQAPRAARACGRRQSGTSLRMPANGDFDQWRHFDDRAADDRTPGPARAVEISGRCVDCWGPVTGRKDGDGRWIRIECQLCWRSVDGEDADREAEEMRGKVEANLPRGRVGHGSKYREGASFVLKILPDMDRDTKKVGPPHSGQHCGGTGARLADSARDPAWQGRVSVRAGASISVWSGRANPTRCPRSHSPTSSSGNRRLSASKRRRPTRRYTYPRRSRLCIGSRLAVN